MLTILRKLTEEVARFSYEELLNEMIADAWYIVIEYHLRLGPVGVKYNLEEAVNNIEIRRSLYCDGLSANDFGERLYNIIYPGYNAAHNNGFKNWVCRDTEEVL